MRRVGIACLALLRALRGAAGSASAASAPAVAVHINIWNGKSTLTLVDRDSFAVLGTAEFSNFVLPIRFNAAGDVLLLATVPQSRKKPVTLWSLDTRTMAKTSVHDLGPGAQILHPDPGSGRLYSVAGTKRSKPMTISLFDIDALKPLGRIASVEQMTGLRISPDGALLYAFCSGHAHKKPKGPPGNLHILDALTGAELARLQVGHGASSVEFDGKRGLAYVMGVAGESEKGKLTVLRGGAVAAQVDVRGRPTGLRLAPDGGSYVLTSNAVIALAADGLAAERTWALTFGPSDLIFDPGHDLMFAGAGSNSMIAVLAMSKDEVLAQHATGSEGKKFGKGIGAALYFLFAVAAAAGGASGSPFFVVQNSTSMLLRDDGAILYVLNPYTSDVSIFDVAKRDVVDIVATGGGSRRILQLPGDSGFWVESRAALAHFDTSTNRVDRTIDFSEGIQFKTVGYEAARERAWVTRKSEVLVFDLRTGEKVGQAEVPMFSHALWIDNSRTPEPDSPRP